VPLSLIVSVRGSLNTFIAIWHKKVSGRMCKIEGCDAKPVAKELCAKHYMRQRRHGSADEVRKPGRPRDQVLDTYRSLFREWSPRTLARYKRAMDIARGLNLAEGEKQKFVETHTRPNGTLNVSAMLFLAEVNDLMIRNGLTLDQAIMAYVKARSSSRARAIYHHRADGGVRAAARRWALAAERYLVPICSR
jgi:hypothetical protein